MKIGFCNCWLQVTYAAIVFLQPNSASALSVAKCEIDRPETVAKVQMEVAEATNEEISFLMDAFVACHIRDVTMATDMVAVDAWKEACKKAYDAWFFRYAENDPNEMEFSTLRQIEQCMRIMASDTYLVGTSASTHDLARQIFELATTSENADRVRSTHQKALEEIDTFNDFVARFATVVRKPSTQ